MDTINNNKVVKRRVGIDPNPVRIKEMLDKDGNVINPVTKEIIKKANKDE